MKKAFEFRESTLGIPIKLKDLIRSEELLSYDLISNVLATSS